MLVLTRKIGEVIQIGGNVLVEVVEMRGGRVRLGITAPDSVDISRAEIRETVKSAQAQIPTISRSLSRHDGISKSSDALIPTIP